MHSTATIGLWLSNNFRYKLIKLKDRIVHCCCNRYAVRTMLFGKMSFVLFNLRIVDLLRITKKHLTINMYSDLT